MALTAADVTRIEALKAKAGAENDRMDEAEDRLNLYVDDFEEIIDKELALQFSEKTYSRIKLFINGSQNIVKRVVDEISIIYTEEPTRTTEPESTRYAEIVEETRLDLKMKKVNRFTNLFNECIVKIGAREDRLKGWQIVYDILTPDMVMVIQNEDDPTIADGYVYLRAWRDTKNNVNSEYHYWHVDGVYKIFDKEFRLQETIYGNGEGDDEYPYRNSDGRVILPFVDFHRTEPDNDFWDRDSGRDLINATIAVHMKMTLFDYYYKVSSIKQIYTIGNIGKIPQDQLLDPLNVFSVPSDENAQIGVLDMQIAFNELRESIQFQINGTINNYGISSDAFSLSVPEMSGRALLIKNRSLLQRIKNQLPLYRDSETEMFEKTRIVNNAWPQFEDISDKAEFSIDFKEITFADEPKDELEFDMMELKSGRISLGQFYMKKNPDIETIEDAEKIIIANLEALSKVIEEVPEVDAAINAILGSRGGGGTQPPDEEEV